MQAGKKKLVLDHLIVQKMDSEEDTDNVSSILAYGANLLFKEDENDESRNINCTWILSLVLSMLTTFCRF